MNCKICGLSVPAQYGDAHCECVASAEDLDFFAADVVKGLMPHQKGVVKYLKESMPEDTLRCNLMLKIDKMYLRYCHIIADIGGKPVSDLFHPYTYLSHVEGYLFGSVSYALLCSD